MEDSGIPYGEYLDPAQGPTARISADEISISFQGMTKAPTMNVIRDLAQQALERFEKRYLPVLERRHGH